MGKGISNHKISVKISGLCKLSTLKNFNASVVSAHSLYGKILKEQKSTTFTAKTVQNLVKVSAFRLPSKQGTSGF
jgi:hypothetical protein